jgi:nicotinamidase-related amidase
MVEAVALPDPRRSVLFVVDMQNSVIHERGACAVAGDPVATLAAAVGPCRLAIEAARRAGVPIVFTR